MAIPKTKEQLKAEMSDQAKWLQALQTQEGNDEFNYMLGKVVEDLDEEDGGGYSKWTTEYRDSGRTITAENAANQVWDFIQTNGKDAWRTAFNELNAYNTGAKKWDFYEKNVKKVVNPNNIQDTGLTSGVKSFIAGDGEQAVYQQRLNEINSIKAAYIAGQTRSLSEQFAKEERNLQTVQRRYGITGAQAMAQLEEFQLKKNKMMSDMESKAASDLDARFKAESLQLGAMKRQVESNSRNNIVRLVAGGHIKDVESLKKLLAENEIKHSLDDNDLQSWIDHKEQTQSLIKTII